MQASTKKPCAAPGCRAMIGPTLPFCPSHWRILPGSIRRAIWLAYREGRGSEQHLESLQAALDHLTAKDAENVKEAA